MIPKPSSSNFEGFESGPKPIARLLLWTWQTYFHDRIGSIHLPVGLPHSNQRPRAKPSAFGLNGPNPRACGWILNHTT